MIVTGTQTEKIIEIQWIQMKLRRKEGGGNNNNDHDGILKITASATASYIIMLCVDWLGLLDFDSGNLRCGVLGRKGFMEKEEFLDFAFK